MLGPFYLLRNSLLSKLILYSEFIDEGRDLGGYKIWDGLSFYLACES